MFISLRDASKLVNRHIDTIRRLVYRNKLQFQRNEFGKVFVNKEQLLTINFQKYERKQTKENNDDNSL